MAGWKLMARGVGPCVPVKFINMVAYEWDWESVDEHGDILDHYHFDKLENLNPPWEMEDPNHHWELVLVRDVFECEKGRPKGGYEDLMDRTWAYPKDGVFPDTFMDGTKMPKYKAAEYAKAKANLVPSKYNSPP